GAIILLIIAELALRLAESPRPGDFVDHPFYDVVRGPSRSRVFKSAHGEHVVRTNSHGLRGPELALPKPRGVFRVLFVGGSVVDSQYLSDEQTIHQLVAKRLQELSGGKVRVEAAAAGSPGTGSAITLAQIANRFLELEPDVIVELNGADFFEWLRPDYEPTYLYLAKPAGSEGRVNDLLRSSRLLALVRGRGGEASFQAAAQAKRREQPFVDPPEDLLARGLARARRSFHRSAVLCRDSGIELAVVTHLTLYKENQPPQEDEKLWLSYGNGNVRAGGWNLSPAFARRLVDAYNEMLRDFARASGTLLVDAAAGVPANLETLIDDVHPTAAGAAKIAELTVQQIAGRPALRKKLGLSPK
ncbi:MAG TPA: SGNH/GDSL hydrolase family protein, partial [Bdellovibrionales bacterium]|nr:SGNH/GDSL hydrolase family protein [Bdellovibrionales bacterium]